MQFKKTQFPDETWTYIAPTWEEMGEICFDLGAAIIKSQKKFDVLVTLAKGGWTWSRTMVDLLDIPNLASFELVLYDPSKPGEKLKHMTLSTPLSVPLQGKKILLFDDVSDTGESLKWAIKYLQCFGPKSIMTATLFHKPHSEYKPDFFGLESDAWIVFPHERRETIVGLAKKWSKKGMSTNVIKKRLIKIGLMKKEIDLFLKLEKTY